MLLNPAASWDVRPTPGVPGLTSGAGTSLSFVFVTLPAAPVCSRSSRSQSGSSEHTGVPCEVWWCALPAHGFSPLSRGCRSASLPAPPCRWLPLPDPNTVVPNPPSVYLLISVHGFTAPHFVPQYSALEMFICRDPDVSSCISGRFHGFSGWSGTYTAQLRGPAEKGVPYSSTILTPPSLFFFKILFIHLSQTDKENKQGEGQAGGEAGSLLSKESNMELDPRALES